MSSKDYRLIQEIIEGNSKKALILEFENLVGIKAAFEYPLDEDIKKELKAISDICKDGDDYIIYKSIDKINELWESLIKKAIICLRYFDPREPFQRFCEKKPHAYGIENLSEYYKNYGEFEKVLYGGVKYYRDHVVHAFRVWLLGIYQMLDNNCQYLKDIVIDAEYKDEIGVCEKISMWTLIALCHDLGYPLEKSLQIIERTRKMMKSFVNNPLVNMDVSFSGVQDSMNDYVLRFVSSKMWHYDVDSHYTMEDTVYKSAFDEEINKCDTTDEKEKRKSELHDKQRFVARIQPKYYFKFQKSLEKNEHGILSSLIVYKALLYFLESDYSINEDYQFDRNDARQFYIRREILRSIASHTCDDIYQNDINRFSLLLILCDDAQEWGRKGISELYVSKNVSYELTRTVIRKGKCEFEDTYSNLPSKDDLPEVLAPFKRQCLHYRSLFRDGLDTGNRNFEFKRKINIKVSEVNEIHYSLELDFSKNKQTTITCLGYDDDISNLLVDVQNGIFREYRYEKESDKLVIYID